ncbi:MAG: NTP transferase domain-containing protein [Prevotella sp.]|nr:NTP transferase domain-containing protein [Prevotella sp.]MCM1075667.1 NTP transferase domain-containing protein [Ruminococcus sp.]
MHYGIIAAGEGSRLMQEGVELPKPLVCLNGEPLLNRLIDIFEKCRAESISVIVNEQMLKVRTALERIAAHCPVPVNIVVKSTPSSMHSFYELSKVMGREGKFILTTVDTVFRPDEFERYVSAFENAPESIDALMGVTGYIDDEKPLYVGVDTNSEITTFSDVAVRGDQYASGGIYGLNAKAFDVLEECMQNGVSRMRNFQRALLADGLKVKAYVFEKIIDVDHAGDIAKAEAFVREVGKNSASICRE